jgi:hypothetical protein
MWARFHTEDTPTFSAAIGQSPYIMPRSRGSDNHGNAP